TGGRPPSDSPPPPAFFCRAPSSCSESSAYCWVRPSPPPAAASLSRNPHESSGKTVQDPASQKAGARKGRQFVQHDADLARPNRSRAAAPLGGHVVAAVHRREAHPLQRVPPLRRRG